MVEHADKGLSRRIFLADLGKTTLGLAVFGITACSGDAVETTVLATTTTATSPTATTAGPVATTAAPSTTEGSNTTVPPTTDAPTTEPRWERVVLGGVSAYVVVRAGEAIVVDTGNPGSESTIEATLTALGVAWTDVAHVILTHHHNDHQGSITAVMNAAPDASAYAGSEDIPAINAPRPLIAVGDGDSVAGLDIIATPGHTPGHISALDTELSLLIAGDALVGEGGGAAGPIDRFTDDLALAYASVMKLAAFEYDGVVFGHGEPLLGGASLLVADLSRRL